MAFITALALLTPGIRSPGRERYAVWNYVPESLCYLLMILVRIHSLRKTRHIFATAEFVNFPINFTTIDPDNNFWIRKTKSIPCVVRHI